ncbi:NfeD family protein [Nesterenkonia sandarakina]|uniref:Membrane protein implicated in regulation of membrane protease activity n=1 Tax=Nesterenkonia sandarakina TaxID=272918 RepID=A0A7Z0E9T4_9MICC|nr:NfeD family protein [Nesterenkonia sandarakina]NYJ17703.1 membrane protein implicated in regulation of membrane protease activity [Nesterenkonia sandarakina]
MIEWFGDNLWAPWLALALGLLVLEAITLDLLFLMLAVGAGAATTVALAGGEPWLQVLVGCATALLMLGAVRPIALKHLKKGPANQLTNIDRMTGMEAHALEAITGDAGLAEVDGDTWTARTTGGLRIEPGMDAVVESVEGAIVYLRPSREINWDEPGPDISGPNTPRSEGA